MFPNSDPRTSPTTALCKENFGLKSGTPANTGKQSGEGLDPPGRHLTTPPPRERSSSRLLFSYLPTYAGTSTTFYADAKAGAAQVHCFQPFGTFAQHHAANTPGIPRRAGWGGPPGGLKEKPVRLRGWNKGCLEKRYWLPSPPQCEVPLIGTGPNWGSYRVPRRSKMQSAQKTASSAKYHIFNQKLLWPSLFRPILSIFAPREQQKNTLPSSCHSGGCKTKLIAEGGAVRRL